jgi:hypothetical protein
MRHTFICLTWTFLLKTVNVQSCLLLVQGCPQGGAVLNKIQGLLKWVLHQKWAVVGGGVAYYLIVRGNITIYVCFCGNYLYLFVYLQSKGLENVQTCLSFPFVVILYTLHYISVGERGSAVGWCTAQQVRRSRVRFPIVSLEFFVDTILPAAPWPWGWLSL